MYQNDAHGIAISEDPDQTRGAVGSVSVLIIKTYLSENFGSSLCLSRIVNMLSMQ